MSHPNPTFDPENVLPEDLGEDDETTQDKMRANAYVESLETPEPKHFYSPILEVIKLMK